MPSPKILVIRRDNIGDLVCTTPLIAALRQRFPDAYIAALVNTYNQDALRGNPKLNAVFAYAKGKHLSEGESLFSSYVARIRLFARLRRERFDYAILAGQRYQAHARRFAVWAGARHIVGFVDAKHHRGIDMPVPYGEGAGLHEVEDMFRLGAPLGIAAGPPPAPEVFADPDVVARVNQALAVAGLAKTGPATPATKAGPLIAIHISARKPSQRWPAAHFAEAMLQLHSRHAARFVLLWAPGAEDNPRHPGDDGKAAEVSRLVAGLPVLAWPTASLPELVAALSLADAVLCADGGAMHLASGLGRPIACLFGDSQPLRWRPWGVPHAVLQAASRDVRDVGVSEAVAALDRLINAV